MSKTNRINRIKPVKSEDSALSSCIRTQNKSEKKGSMFIRKNRCISIYNLYPITFLFNLLWFVVTFLPYW